MLLSSARGKDLSLPWMIKVISLIPIKSKVFIQRLHKTQNMHKISFSFDFNNKKEQQKSLQIQIPSTLPIFIFLISNLREGIFFGLLHNAKTSFRHLNYFICIPMHIDFANILRY